MRQFPLIACVLLLGGCGASQTGAAGSLDVRRTTTDIETSEGVSYAITQTVERNVSSGTVTGTPEAAWGELPEVYREIGIPVTLVDARNKLLGTTDNRLSRIGSERPGRYLDCGSGLAGQYANVYQVYVSVVTQLHASEGGGTRVSTQLEAAARNAGHNNPPVRCTSRGVLEKEILEALQLRLARSAG